MNKYAYLLAVNIKSVNPIRFILRHNSPQRNVKRVAVHFVFLGLVISAAAQARAMSGIDHSSLLYTLVSGEEIAEGPLDPSAYAQTNAPGVGGARLAAVDAGLGVDLITFEDAEVNFSASLGGNVVIAPLSPVETEPETAVKENTLRTNVAQIYTVESDDTISGIAQKFNVSTDTILWANGLSDQTTLRVGDHLNILPTTGVLYTVKSGDTLLAIANSFDVEAGALREYNQLADSHTLAIGQKLIIPGGAIAPASVPNIVSSNTQLADRSADGPTPEPITVKGAGMIWPTTSKHISQGFRWGHTGIDIDNRARPAIYSALGGTVEYAGWLGGYGNLIIVNHGSGLQTYYAHLEKIYVGKGAAVNKGDAVGKMGSTGRSTGPHLHFEVRLNGRPQNPLNYAS